MNVILIGTGLCIFWVVMLVGGGGRVYVSLRGGMIDELTRPYIYWFVGLMG